MVQPQRNRFFYPSSDCTGEAFMKFENPYEPVVEELSEGNRYWMTEGKVIEARIFSSYLDGQGGICTAGPIGDDRVYKIKKFMLPQLVPPFQIVK